MRPGRPVLLVFVVAAVFVGAAAIPAQAARRIKEFAVPGYNSYPNHITAGPDGALWFTELGGNIGRITTEGTFTEYPVPTPNSAPYAITSGPDGSHLCLRAEREFLKLLQGDCDLPVGTLALWVNGQIELCAQLFTEKTEPRMASACGIDLEGIAAQVFSQINAS